MANQIKLHREKSGLTQKELANNSGCSQAYIHQLECGKKADPGLSMARRIVMAFCKAGLDCSLDDVFPGVDDKEREAA